MAEVVPFPSMGGVFVDHRGPNRTIRVSQHPERGLVVLSIWTDGICRASFQLSVDDLDDFRAALTTAVEQGREVTEVAWPGLAS